VYGVVTTGAESDLLQVTSIAYQMVTRFGMSEKVGPVNFGDSDGQYQLGAQRTYSDATAQLVDSEVRRIIDECIENGKRLLTEHRKQLDDLVSALLVEDTLDQARILEVTALAVQPTHPGVTV
jgi:cell division protease FtsH